MQPVIDIAFVILYTDIIYIVCGICSLENACRLTVFELTDYLCQIRFLANDSHLTEFRDRIGGADHISVTARQLQICYAYSDPSV